MNAALDAWLISHPTIRLATEKDCRCNDDIQQIRKNVQSGESNPNYEPYLLVGDFRHNGVNDFAVVLTDKRMLKKPKVYVLIFDGPFRNRAGTPAYFRVLDVGLPRSLLLPSQDGGYPLVGPYESEGCLFVPAKEGYKEDCPKF